MQHLDQNNKEFYQAVEIVEETDAIFLLTGKAGAGKTTFLKHISGFSSKNQIILAPTGVAAINAGGMTVHSFSNSFWSIYTKRHQT